ncbi:MAG TPA: PEP-CTERM sorting domain-containing protein [Verrucomicrobiae bacterium]|nr:PEP-CTERM sorting domain-containing protein [Verrucomicrobiae bacterium]
MILYWYPHSYGNSFTIEIEDGWWKGRGEEWAYLPIKPSLMKVALAGDYSNEDSVRFKMRATRANTAGSGMAAIADRYWNSVVVDVPGISPGTPATFVVRAWKTSFGSFDAAKRADFQAFPTGGFPGNSGESIPVSVIVGGGLQPAGNLTGLQSFSIGLIPEPSTMSLLALGAAALFPSSRRGL